MDIYCGQFNIPFWSFAWEREKMTDRLLLQYAVNTAFLILFCGGNEQAIKGSWATLFSLHCQAERERKWEWEEGRENKREFQVKMFSRFYEILRFVQTAPSDAEGTQQKTAQWTLGHPSGLTP